MRKKTWQCDAIQKNHSGNPTIVGVSLPYQTLCGNISFHHQAFQESACDWRSVFRAKKRLRFQRSRRATFTTFTSDCCNHFSPFGGEFCTLFLFNYLLYKAENTTCYNFENNVTMRKSLYLPSYVCYICSFVLCLIGSEFTSFWE